MVYNCASSREWAEGVIERVKTGSVMCSARRMVEDCGSSLEWANTVANRHAWS